MTALTADAEVASRNPGDYFGLPVATATTIYKGAMLVVNASGYVEPATDAASKSTVIGIADEQIVNAGANGAKTVRFTFGRLFRMTQDGNLTQASVGGIAYVLDDATVTNAATAAQDVIAGRIVNYLSATQVEVAIGEFLTGVLTGAPAAGTVTGAHLATVADDNVIGGVPVIHRVDIADGAGDTDVVLTHKTRVLDAWAVKTAANGGSGDTVTVKNGANAISSAIDLNVNDTLIARTTLINDATAEIAAAGTLRITAANNTNNACTVYVLGVRVA